MHLALNISITLLLLVITLAVLFQPWLPIAKHIITLIKWVAVAIALVGSISTFYCLLADQIKSYSLRELDLSYHCGLIFRKTVTQPILRIQHVELKRGPIDRKVGLAKLQVFSAGGAMHTFEIPGLPIADAQAIRQFITSHKDASQHG